MVFRRNSRRFGMWLIDVNELVQVKQKATQVIHAMLPSVSNHRAAFTFAGLALKGVANGNVDLIGGLIELAFDSFRKSLGHHQIKAIV